VFTGNRERLVIWLMIRWNCVMKKILKITDVKSKLKLRCFVWVKLIGSEINQASSQVADGLSRNEVKMLSTWKQQQGHRNRRWIPSFHQMLLTSRGNFLRNWCTHLEKLREARIGWFNHVYCRAWDILVGDLHSRRTNRGMKSLIWKSVWLKL